MAGFTFVASEVDEIKTPTSLSSEQVTVEITFSTVDPELLKALYGDWSEQKPDEEIVAEENNRMRAFQLKQRAPGLDELVSRPCATECGFLRVAVWDTIIHLNDIHGQENSQHRTVWTREDIADWLDTLDIDLRVHNKKEK